MKILQVKIKGIVPKDAKEIVKTDIKRSISDGFIVHDDTVELNVLEFDEIGVKQ